jgi:hypothetical protein
MAALRLALDSPIIVIAVLVLIVWAVARWRGAYGRRPSTPAGASFASTASPANSGTGRAATTGDSSRKLVGKAWTKPGCPPTVTWRRHRPRRHYRPSSWTHAGGRALPLPRKSRRRSARRVGTAAQERPGDRTGRGGAAAGLAVAAV